MKSLLLIFLFAEITCAGQTTSSIKMDGIPQNLTWINNPLDWNYSNKQLTIIAGKKTDLFADPQHEYAVFNSPKAVFIPDSIFQFSGKAEVDFKTDYDAAVLVLYAGDEAWAKLCFEFSPQKKPFVVSVVNNNLSDDVNHVPVSGNTIYLRISGLGNNIFAFHYSTDGKYWNMARYFTIYTPQQIKVGFSSQSPTGDSYKAIFSEINYNTRKLKDLRNGE